MNKKTIKLICYLLVLIFVFLIYQKNNYNNYSYTPIGDGFSLGLNSYKINNYGYSDYIKDYLMKSKKLKTYTKNYCSKNKLIKELEYDIITNKKVVEKGKKYNLKSILRESNLITLSIGLDDIKYELVKNDLNIESTKVVDKIYTKYKKLFKLINSYYPHKIILIGYNENSINNKSIKLIINKLNTKLIKNKDIIFINTTSFMKQSYYLNNHTIYPNTSGYKAISTKIVDKIKNSTCQSKK